LITGFTFLTSIFIREYSYPVKISARSGFRKRMNRQFRDITAEGDVFISRIALKYPLS